MSLPLKFLHLPSSGYALVRQKQRKHFFHRIGFSGLEQTGVFAMTVCGVSLGD